MTDKQGRGVPSVDGEKDARLFWQFARGLVYVLNRNRTTDVFPGPGTVRDAVLALLRTSN
jgi:hypothetical protein